MYRKDVCSHKFLRDLMPVEQEWNGKKEQQGHFWPRSAHFRTQSNGATN